MVPLPVISCVLCGAHIDRPDVESRARWRREWRAIYAEKESPHDVHISGTGTREPYGDVIVPAPASSGQLKLRDDGLAEIWLMGEEFISIAEENQAQGVQQEGEPWQLQAGRARGYPFHKPCWEVLTLVRRGSQVPMVHLFNICRSFPAPSGLLFFGHASGWPPPPELAELNPIEIPEINLFLNGESAGEAPSSDPAFCSRRGLTSRDIFSKIPDEILQCIVEILPSKDVVRLRQASRTCANALLSQSFWKSRFSPGREFEIIIEAHRHASSISGRWDSLYSLARSLRASPAFLNRERVWKLACSLWRVMDQVASSTTHGDPDRGSLRWVEAARTSMRIAPIFLDFEMSLTVPDTLSRVCVYLVDVFGRRYVSGILCGAPNGTADAMGRHSVASGASEVSLSVPEATSIAGFHLAQDNHGIRGLAVLYTSGALSKWAGEPAGVPVRRLVFDPATAASNSVRYLRCTIDALKMDSLSISDGEEADCPFESAMPLVDATRFIPSLPGPDMSVRGMDRDRSEPFRTPITMTMLNAPLRDLEDVSSVSVGMLGPEVAGIEFGFASDTPPVWLGSKPAGVADVGTFALDHAGGERIRGIECYYFFDWGVLIGFKVHTNKGRVGTFSPGPIDERREEFLVESIFPKDGEAIVGFCSRVSPVSLIDLGVVFRTKGPG